MLQTSFTHSALLCGPVPSAVLSCAERILHSKSRTCSSLLFGSRTSASIKTSCCVLQQCLTRLAVLVVCRHRRVVQLLQHWQAWVHAKRSLRQRGTMVHRAHQGYTMQHAWKHWQWLASSKVLHINLLPPVTNVAHNVPPLLALMPGSKVAAMCSITAVSLKPLPLVVSLMTPLHTLVCCV